MYTQNYTVVFRKDKNNEEHYARLNDSSEYYPETGQHATDRYGKPRYALDSSNFVRFPRDASGNERYLKDADGDDWAVEYVTWARYARRHVTRHVTEEVYPAKRLENSESRLERVEYAIELKYAVDRSGNSYYPLGFSGHEYYFYGWGHPKHYPRSNDGHYLAPYNAFADDFVRLPTSKVILTENDLAERVPVFRLPDGFLVEHYLTRVVDRDRQLRKLLDDGDAKKEKNNKKKEEKKPASPPTAVKNVNFGWIIALCVVAVLSCLVWSLKR